MSDPMSLVVSAAIFGVVRHGVLEEPEARPHRSRWRLFAVLVCFLVLLMPGAARSATPTAKPLSVVQFPIPLVASGDHVEIGYDTRGIPSATGFLYVRNDLGRDFARIVMRRRKAEQQLVPSDGLRLLRAVVPERLLRGDKLFYYAVIRDPRIGRSVSVPAAGARAPEFVWVINGAGRVQLGAHRFGHPRAPEAAVARAGPGDVAFENPQEGARFGPWSFDVAPDRSIWLLDELNKRLLVWGPDRPDIPERSVPLSFYPIDFSLGPAGTLYVTRQGPPGTPAIHLTRMASKGEVLWESTLDTEIFNSQLRTGPDGTLYWTLPASRREPSVALSVAGHRPVRRAASRSPSSSSSGGLCGVSSQ